MKIIIDIIFSIMKMSIPYGDIMFLMKLLLIIAIVAFVGFGFGLLIGIVGGRKE